MSLLGDVKPDEEIMSLLRARLKDGQRWAVYQNQAMASAGLGHLQFLKVGPGCTYEIAPSRLPDTQTSINWKYLHVGFVNMETGTVVEIQKGEPK